MGARQPRSLLRNETSRFVAAISVSIRKAYQSFVTSSVTSSSGMPMPVSKLWPSGQSLATAAAQGEVGELDLADFVGQREVETQRAIDGRRDDRRGDGEFLPFRRQFQRGAKPDTRPWILVEHENVLDRIASPAARPEAECVAAGSKAKVSVLHLQVPEGRPGLGGVPSPDAVRVGQTRPRMDLPSRSSRRPGATPCPAAARSDPRPCAGLRSCRTRP